MAHTKAKGTTKLGRDSQSQRLGVKIYGGSAIKCGQIIIRQRGTAYMAGGGVKTGKDDTLYAVKDGVVNFKKIRYTNFTSNKKTKQIVSVIPTVIASSATVSLVASEKRSGKQSKPEEKIAASQTGFDSTPKLRNDTTKVDTKNEKVFVEELKAESQESLNNKSKSAYIKEEQPLKNIPQRKETKK